MKFSIHKVCIATLTGIATTLTLLPVPVQAQSVRQLAYTFGFTKNAALVMRGGSEEPMKGHVNWALNQSETTVKNEILNQVNRFEGAFRNSDRFSCRVFGNLKNARLMLIEGRTEPMEGHVNSCANVSGKQASMGVREEVQAIRSYLR